MSEQQDTSVHESVSNPSQHTSGRRKSWITRIGSTLPTFVVFVALAGIGWWGHATGWKIPKFSEIVNGKQRADDDWCAEHSVPESECVQCSQSWCSVETCTDSSHSHIKDHGWCRIHGVHQCPHCHPDIAQVAMGDESSSESELLRIKRALEVRNRPENNSDCTQYQNVIQFASIDSIRKAGVDVRSAQRKKIVETVPVNAVITYDQTRIAELSGRVSGSVFWAEKQAGDRVESGEILALVDALAVGQAKGELHKALSKLSFHRATVQRIMPLVADGVIPEKRLLEAQSALSEAQVVAANAHQALINLGFQVTMDKLERLDDQQIPVFLRLLGIPDSIREKMTNSDLTSNLLPIHASIDGTIIDRHAVKGEVVDYQQILFKLADTSQMWLNFNIPIEESTLVKIGQSVLFRPDGTSERYQGNISWVSTSIDQATRTLPARAVLHNADGKLRDEMFGGGELVLREDENAVLIPRNALQRDGTCYVVFVRDRNYAAGEIGPKMFYTRSVRTGAVLDDEIEIIAGLLPGEIVATIGSDVLRGQLLKADLGAG